MRRLFVICSLVNIVCGVVLIVLSKGNAFAVVQGLFLLFMAIVCYARAKGCG